MHSNVEVEFSLDSLKPRKLLQPSLRGLRESRLVKVHLSQPLPLDTKTGKITISVFSSAPYSLTRYAKEVQTNPISTRSHDHLTLPKQKEKFNKNQKKKEPKYSQVSLKSPTRKKRYSKLPQRLITPPLLPYLCILGLIPRPQYQRRRRTQQQHPHIDPVPSWIPARLLFLPVYPHTHNLPRRPETHIQSDRQPCCACGVQIPTQPPE